MIKEYATTTNKQFLKKKNMKPCVKIHRGAKLD
jgi:hypothetical protein